MNIKTTTHTPGDLTDFVTEVFSSLVPKDQRATSSYYLQGLMLEGRRKSMQPMAQRLGIDHQRLQQFVSTSPWPVEPVRKTLATRAINLIHPDACGSSMTPVSLKTDPPPLELLDSTPARLGQDR